MKLLAAALAIGLFGAYIQMQTIADLKDLKALVGICGQAHLDQIREIYR